jgi:hypothetical protein
VFVQNIQNVTLTVTVTVTVTATATVTVTVTVTVYTSLPACKVIHLLRLSPDGSHVIEEKTGVTSVAARFGHVLKPSNYLFSHYWRWKLWLRATCDQVTVTFEHSRTSSDSVLQSFESGRHIKASPSLLRATMKL